MNLFTVKRKKNTRMKSEIATKKLRLGSPARIIARMDHSTFSILLFPKRKWKKVENCFCG